MQVGGECTEGKALFLKDRIGICSPLQGHSAHQTELYNYKITITEIKSFRALKIEVELKEGAKGCSGTFPSVPYGIASILIHAQQLPNSGTEQ